MNMLSSLLAGIRMCTLELTHLSILRRNNNDVRLFTILQSHFYVPPNLLAGYSTFPLSILHKQKFSVGIRIIHGKIAI